MSRIFALIYFFLLQTTLPAQNNAPELRMKAVDSKDGVALLLISQCHAPLDFYVKNFLRDSIIQSDIIHPFDSMIIWNLGKGDKAKLFRHFKAEHPLYYFFGDTSKIHPQTDYLYSLPFQKDKKYRVIQGFNGDFSHKSQYAIDFSMRIGEPVHAAREGIVVQVVDKFTERGGPEFGNKANKIRIQHDDGTIAAYLHLKKNGSKVSEGDHVKRGEPIGLSGNTGYSTQPHLHFMVEKGKGVSIPIYFEGYEGEILKKLKKYKRK